MPQPRSADERAEAVIDHDLELKGKVHHQPGDLVVHGWVEVGGHGKLICDGNLTCLGAVVEGGGSLACRALVTNFLEVDNSGGETHVKADWIRARVVHHVQRGLADMLDRGDVTADYCQHFGGELNPSFDYARGKVGLRREFYAREGAAGEGVSFSVNAIRDALRKGKDIFRPRVEPLVWLEQCATAEAPAVSDPVLDRFLAWLEGHAGPQRALLEAIQAEWLGRLESLPADVRAQASRAIRRVLKSPRITGERDQLCQRLCGELPASAPPAAAPGRRLVRHPRDIVRVRVDAWLGEFNRSVERLDLSHQRRVEEIPAGIAEYTQLRELQLAGNRVARISPTLGRLARLEVLDLQGNRLASLPDELGQLSALRSLNLESNPQLTRLPDTLCGLARLESLCVGFTALEGLPEQFGRLCSLKFLDLHGCKRLERLPESFFSLPRLDSLYLHGTGLPGSQLGRIRQRFPNCEFWNFFR